MGQPQRDPRKTTGARTTDRRDVLFPIRSPATPAPAPSGWTQQEKISAGIAALLAFALLSWAVWQTSPREPSVAHVRQGVRNRDEQPVAGPSPADAPRDESAVEAIEIAAGETAHLPPIEAQKTEPGQPKPGKVKSKKTGDEKKAPIDKSPPAAAARDFSAPDGTAGGTTPPAEVKAAPPQDPPTKEDVKLAAAPTNVDAPPSRKSIAEPEKKPALKKPAAPLETDHRNDAAAIDESDEYDESGAEDFACPVPWLRDSRMAERVKYLNGLQGLLKSGWEEKPAALEAAREQYQAAKKICPDDPRLGYAWGLVLWKAGEHDEARKEWEAATRTGPQPFLPALCVLAWARLIDRDDAGGFASIERAAEALASAGGDYPTAAQRSHATLFLGRAIGFLKGPGKSTELIDQVLATEQKLVDRLPDDLLKTFQHGQDQAAKRFEEFQKLSERPEAELVAELRRQQQRLADDLKDVRQELKLLDDRRKAIPREAKKRLTALTDEAAEIEEKIESYSTGIQQGQAQAAALAQPRQIFAGYRPVVVQVPVTVKENGKDVTRWQTSTQMVPQYRTETQPEVQARIKDRDDVVAKLKDRSKELKEFQDRLEAIPDEKIDIAKTLRLERQEKSRAAALARRRMAELMAQERELLKGYSTPAELRRQMTSLAPYVPWTPESDREGLVASYRQKAAPRAAVTPRDMRKASK
jgi:hypothetical protein